MRVGVEAALELYLLNMFSPHSQHPKSLDPEFMLPGTHICTVIFKVSKVWIPVYYNEAVMVTNDSLPDKGLNISSFERILTAFFRTMSRVK